MVDDRFELVARLGGGGMGTVWRARDLALHREVALKEVRPPDPALAEYDPEGARELRIRVLREARALARVAHPQVVTIHHIVDGGEGTYPWLVMELVAGGSLQDRLDRGDLTAGEAAPLGRGILAGLRAAHAAGIQHRDIKPANILLRPDGQPVLTDFGIAAIHGATALTAAGSIIGTPEYMAPERVAGEEGGPPADLWSLAMTLYVAVEGHHPLRRTNTLATLAAVLGEDVPPPRRAGPLTRVLTGVLVRDPAARPDGEALDRMLAEVETETAAEAQAPLEAETSASAGGGGHRVDAEPRDAVPAGAGSAGTQGPTPPAEIPPGSGAQGSAPPTALPQGVGARGSTAAPSVPPSGLGIDVAAADTATVFPLAPPAPASTPSATATPPAPPTQPPATRKRRRGAYAGAAGAAVVLSGVLVWNLLPLGGEKSDGEGNRTAGKPSSQGGPSASSSSSSPSTGASAANPSSGADALTIGIKFDQPGLGFKNPDGTYAGLDVDVATYIASGLGYRPSDIRWKEVRSSTRESLLSGGDVDLVVATYTMTSLRDKKVDFVGPYFMAHQDVLLAADNTSVKSRTDLNGLKVCTATGSSTALLIRTNLAPQAQVVTHDSYARCISDLASGAVDAVTTDDTLLAGYAQQNAYKGRFRLAGFRITDEPYAIGVPEGGDRDRVIQRVLQKMVDDGAWKKAVEKNLPLLRTATPPVQQWSSTGGPS
ncbi:bifunctional serine/threonine-protein kinase/glutamate ABC transporter substrate-binding protein [Streptomyces sp. NBC_00572]|uniref:bifunctional serine/threonine-protein kinase/glutamate ABC transporter substrate-binding protein n=1 Tax=Streptomyces sp. NBC_00572 TaxID=2903664 RepID=UPI00225406D3|nr:bifunctional serine/threonine-protein kinase/glutamate ABC transporter substrate-binding protein [Streptomyces sp. NBC_00572]MCX4985565.1 transporter substrate-binding domain-containing protein [Streptomyces sp. NBC_00572]